MKTKLQTATVRMTLPRVASVMVSLCLALCVPAGNAQAQGQQPAKAAAVAPHLSSKDFNEAADAALVAMRRTAEELGIGGVALVSYCEGDTVQSWSSKMVVVGRMKDDPSATSNGSNLLAIAYAKAAEMAETLKDSGSKVRPPMVGEVGWQGGMIVRGRTGYLIAAFSGGKSEDDLKVSHAGLEVLKSKL